MKLKFQTLLFQKLGISIPGLKIHRLNLNRHRHETEWVERHQHPFHQLLLYLTGHGIQRIEAHEHEITPGTLLIIPSSIIHEFKRKGGVRPMCLSMDFSLSTLISLHQIRLTRTDLFKIHQQLTILTSLNSQKNDPLFLQTASCVLHLMHLIMKLSGLIPEAKQRLKSPILKSVEKILNEKKLTIPSTHEVIEKIGYQKDYLNRVIKRETGLTLGQLISSYRLRETETLLRTGQSIGDISEKAGFTDQNYFARWFRLQTGMSPSQWRRSPSIQPINLPESSDSSP